MNNQKFLGICIVVASLLVAASIFSLARTQRYQLVQGSGQIYVQDTVTGETYMGWKKLNK